MIKLFLLFILSYAGINSQAKKTTTDEEAYNPKELEQLIKKEIDKSKDSSPIRFGAFIDSYYSHNLNKPKITERKFIHINLII